MTDLERRMREQQEQQGDQGPFKPVVADTQQAQQMQFAWVEPLSLQQKARFNRGPADD